MYLEGSMGAALLAAIEASRGAGMPTHEVVFLLVWALGAVIVGGYMLSSKGAARMFENFQRMEIGRFWIGASDPQRTRKNYMRMCRVGGCFLLLVGAPLLFATVLTLIDRLLR
jgi:hypothetical protein